MHLRFKSDMSFIITPLVQELLRRTKMFLIPNMQSNIFAFLTLALKIRTRGATESQSHNSNVN